MSWQKCDYCDGWGTTFEVDAQDYEEYETACPVCQGRKYVEKKGGRNRVNQATKGKAR